MSTTGREEGAGSPARRETPPVANAEPRRNGVGVAALVVGIVSLVLAILIIFFPLAGILGIVAIVLGGIGMGRAGRGIADNRGQALTGLITGLLAFLVAVALGLGIGSFVFQHANDFRKLGSCMDKAQSAAARQTCARAFGNQLHD